MGTTALNRYSGAVNTASTTWGACASGTALDITVDAAAGDVIELGLSAFWAATGFTYSYFDAATMVSGSPVNWVSTGSGTHGNGVFSWFCINDNAFMSAGAGGWTYTVQSGDLVSGQVTFRLYQKVAAGTRALATSAPIHFWAAKCENGATSGGLTGTLASSSFTALTGTVTVNAVAGDVLAISPHAIMADSNAGTLNFDAATMVSSAPVNWVSTGTSSHTSGVPAWRNNGANFSPIKGTVLYTVQAGDVVSGQVTIKLYGSTSTGSRALDSGSTFVVRKV